MSEKEEELRDQAAPVDPPENTKAGSAMSMDSTEEKANAIDPPENTSSNS